MITFADLEKLPEMASTFQVGRFTCEMRFASGQLEVGWSPELPTCGSLSAEDLDQYRNGRAAFLARVTEALGGGAALVIE